MDKNIGVCDAKMFDQKFFCCIFGLNQTKF